ncbi:MAG: HAMP domain-containing histidine kinase [Oscillospiraceae bacterium]|nr:HAMP domain-containing histidine kinase [Oscillospiraceae bacterium]
MINFNRIIIIITVLFILLITSANIILINFTHSDEKHHLVEINRAFTEIIENGFSDNISGYQYITGISLIENDFGFNDNNPYVIRAYNDRYIKFNYTNDTSNNNIIILNVFFAIVVIVIFVILVYIKQQIIKPFNKISEMPYELSKGHLVKGLKEEKNRFFGKFIWGLDLLRETLEKRKTKELMLLKEKKTLVLSISHDIKTPLSAIKLYTKAMSEGLGSSDELAEKIDQNADKIETFINDIIKTSKEDILDIEVRNSEFYLIDLLSRVDDYYCDKMELLKIEFEIKSFEDCLIYGDIDRTVEAFENIIENAIKYGDGKSISINAVREEACCLVTISNSGNTLPAEEMIRVFDSFWRGSNAKDKKGSGLGLYICRRILTQMSGDIFIEEDGDNIKITAVLKVL